MSDTVKVPREPTDLMVDAADDATGFELLRDDIRTAYRAMLSAAPQSSDGWIPVGERLPATEVAVLAILETGEDVGVFGRGIEQVVAWHSVHSDIWYARGEQVKNMYKARITFWMPLPSPPEKDKP